jgi:nitrate/nitrite transport system substrate-binding protein
MKPTTKIRMGSMLGVLSFILLLSLQRCNSGESIANSPTAYGAEVADEEIIKLGIIPLTDCAPLVVAFEKGLFKKYGVNVQISKESSWANVRDKLLTGELQGAHCLFGMPFSVYTGVGGKEGSELPIAMMLNNNGQSITLSNEFCGKVNARDIHSAGKAIRELTASKEVTFAGTFPGGTHDIWLRYWLAAAGVDQAKVRILTIPPPQMVANMKVGNMDGFCVGEPWNQVAVKQQTGFTHIATQDIWKHHPEKALVVNKDFSVHRRGDLKKVMKAILEASIWLDQRANRAEAATIIGRASYVNVPAAEIARRLEGVYDMGCDYGQREYTDDYMLFHRDGQTNYPRKAHGIWYLAQYVRFGYLTGNPEYAAIADKLILQDLYNEVAGEMNIAIPEDDMKPFTIGLDQVTFDAKDPVTSLKAYKPVM